MTDVGAAMGLTGSVFATPNFIDYTVERRQDPGQRRMMVQLGDVSYNLEKLSQTLRLADRIRASSVSVEQANRRLDEIEALRPPYPVPAAGVAYAACGAGFAVILSAAWGDVAIAAALSIVVFLLVQASSRSEWIPDPPCPGRHVARERIFRRGLRQIHRRQHVSGDESSLEVIRFAGHHAYLVDGILRVDASEAVETHGRLRSRPSRIARRRSRAHPLRPWTGLQPEGWPPDPNLEVSTMRSWGDVDVVRRTG